MTIKIRNVGHVVLKVRDIVCSRVRRPFTFRSEE